MDPRLLKYYNQELQYMREMGGEFAREYPKIWPVIRYPFLSIISKTSLRPLKNLALILPRLSLNRFPGTWGSLFPTWNF